MQRLPLRLKPHTRRAEALDSGKAQQSEDLVVLAKHADLGIQWIQPEANELHVWRTVHHPRCKPVQRYEPRSEEAD